MLQLYVATTTRLTARLRQLAANDEGLSETISVVLLMVLGVVVVGIVGTYVKPWIEAKLSGGLG